ncbi:MAG: hypothetical protein ACI85O_002536 [Saprospiraceae bacterium]|jgi:hypothetical protein
MKAIVHLFLLILLAASCANPQKVLERNHPDKALEITLKRLTRGKIKTKHFPVLEKSFRIVTERDRLAIQKMRNSQRPEVWPAVYEKAVNVNNRQQKVARVSQRLQRVGYSIETDFLPANKIMEEAAAKAAIYYYARAQEHIIQGRNGDRQEARLAHDYLSRCLFYSSDYQDAFTLQTEMKNAGTTHVLVRFQNNPYIWNESGLYQELFWGLNFPLMEEWQMTHRTAPSNVEMHYAIDLSFTDVHVSANRTSSSICTTSKEIENGYIEKQVWSAQDSTYITIKETQYITISATVETFEQYKDAAVNLEVNFMDLQSNQYFDRKTICGRESWTNRFDKVRGDRRALTSCQCRRSIGFCSTFPSDYSIIEDAVDDLRWSAKRILRRQLD